MPEKCKLDWKTCGHCKVNAFCPGEDYPRCDKTGFWKSLLGGDMCPNAPWGDDNLPDGTGK